LSLGQVEALRRGEYPHKTELNLAQLPAVFAADKSLTQGLDELCMQAIKLVRAHAVRWPRSRAWRRFVTSARLENVRALLGPLFPLLALPCRIETLPALPTRFETGDAILVLRRR